MEDNSIERDKPFKPEVVRINQDFLLLGPERTIRKFNSTFWVEQFSSQVLLDFSGKEMFPVLPIRIYFSPGRCTIQRTITPFDPELGYQITAEDLNLSERLEKIQREQDRLKKLVPFDRAPLWINLMNMSRYNLEELGLIEPGPDLEHFTPEATSIFSRLRLQLKIITSNEQAPSYLESRPNRTGLAIREITFREFYPLDTGPLATPTDSIDAVINNIEEGLSVYVPSDLEKIKTIEGRFLLLGKKNE